MKTKTLNLKPTPKQVVGQEVELPSTENPVADEAPEAKKTTLKTSYSDAKRAGMSYIPNTFIPILTNQFESIYQLLNFVYVNGMTVNVHRVPKVENGQVVGYTEQTVTVLTEQASYAESLLKELEVIGGHHFQKGYMKPEEEVKKMMEERNAPAEKIAMADMGETQGQITQDVEG